MTEGHNVAVYGVLLAVVLVGAVGFYFTANEQSGAPQIIYVGGGSQVSAPSTPFKVFAHGITGRDIEQFGTATVTLSTTLDLRCDKCTITCTGSITQGADAVDFYTCGDSPNIGGTLVCDVGVPGGPGDSGSDPTTSLTCESTQANGAFVLANHGANAQLQATMVSSTVGGSAALGENVLYDNTLYNCQSAILAGNGCDPADADCNNCPAPDTLGCDKDTDPATLTPDTITECENFLTSGGCVCECFSIHIDDLDTIHQLKSGATLEFVVKKTLVQPPLSPCPP